MAAAAPAAPPLSSREPTVEADDSNISSPLSDVEDKDGDPDDMDGMTVDNDEKHDGASDSDSNLSEANDTEAETERLYDTPPNQRQKDIVLNPFNDGIVAERTPSKLQNTMTVDKIRENGDDTSLSDEEMSDVGSSHADDQDDSPTKPKSTEPSSVDELKQLSDGRKRKRSPAADQSDEEEAPLRKRTASVGIQELENNGDNNGVVGDKLFAEKPQSDEQSPAEDASGGIESKDEKEDTAAEDSAAADSRPSKKIVRGGNKQNHVGGEGGDNEEPDTVTDEDGEQRADDEGIEADVEEEADVLGKNDEEVEKKRIAMEEWNGIEARFSAFRDRLYRDRLEKLEREEELLTAETPRHPEYLNMKQCIDDRHAERLRQINKEYEYVLQAHERLAIARRAEIWSQFYQAMREKREYILEELNKDWYDTQTARRSAHSVQDFALLFPASPAQRTRNAVAYNTEVSILSGLAKHVGFPAVPAMRGASAAEIEDDLEAMKQAGRQRQHSAIHPAVFSTTLDPAGEQFIKNTPWANPNHPNHHSLKGHGFGSADGDSATLVGTQGQPSQGKNGSSSSHQQNGHSSGHKSPPAPPPNRATTHSPEMTRSTSSTGHHHMKRVTSLPGIAGRASKAIQETASKHETALAMGI